MCSRPDCKLASVTCEKSASSLILPNIEGLLLVLQFLLVITLNGKGSHLTPISGVTLYQGAPGSKFSKAPLVEVQRHELSDVYARIF